MALLSIFKIDTWTLQIWNAQIRYTDKFSVVNATNTKQSMVGLVLGWAETTDMGADYKSQVDEPSGCSGIICTIVFSICILDL